MNSAGMLTSPGRRPRTAQTRILALFTLGLLAGGVCSSITLETLSGAASLIPQAVRYAFVLAAAAVLVGAAVGMLQLRLPENRRLIPKALFGRGRSRAAIQFGFELGTGARTYVPSPAPYLLTVAIVMLSPGWAVALAVGLGFGLGRSIMTWLRYSARDQEEWDCRLGSLAPSIAVVSTVAIAVWVLSLIVKEMI